MIVIKFIHDYRRSICSETIEMTFPLNFPIKLNEKSTLNVIPVTSEFLISSGLERIQYIGGTNSHSTDCLYSALKRAF